MRRSFLGKLKAHLEVPVNHVVDLEVLVVVAEGVEQRLRHLDPAHVAEQLYEGEEGEVEVGRVPVEGRRVRVADVEVREGLGALVLLPRDEVLTAEEGGQEVAEDGERGHLGVDQTNS